MSRAMWVGLLVLGCGAASRSTASTETAGAEPASSEAASSEAASSEARSAESEACRAERLATLDAMEASRQGAACAVDADCAVVTGPGHPDPEYGEVVAAGDAAELDARAEAHLSRCGAFHHHEAIDAFRVIEAACSAGRCAANETVFHVEE